MKHRFKLTMCLLITLFTGGAGAFFMRGAVEGWYQYLIKPSFTPPAWIFAPVWTILYLMIGYSAYQVYKNRTLSEIKLSAILFFIQLVLNASWTLVFFGMRSIFGGLVVIFLLWSSILLLINLFSKESKLAARLLIPYFLWVSFASILNFSIWRLNS